jgi:hypothetical protein
MGSSVYQCDLGANRRWKICFCQEIRTQYQTHDDPNTRSHLVVLLRIPDVIRNVDGVDFQQGLPDLDNLDSREKHLIILDDLMDETNQRVASLFTKKSHHRNISVMYIVQNLFHRGKYHRTISLNAHYMVVFKNPRDVAQIMDLAHQMYPKRTNYFLESTLQPLLNPTATDTDPWQSYLNP